MTPYGKKKTQKTKSKDRKKTREEENSKSNEIKVDKTALDHLKIGKGTE